MAKEGKVIPLRPYIRDGEGTVIESARKMVPLPDGSNRFELTLELGNAPVPEREYSADIASLIYRNENVYLMFAQEKHVPEKEADALRTLLVVSMSTHGALIFLRSCRDFAPQLRKFATQLGLNKTLTAIKEEPTQTVALAANMILAAYAGREASLDMYMASPFVLSQLGKNGKFAVRPVVRVILSTGLILAIYDELEKLKDKFPKDELETFEQASEKEEAQ